MTATANKNLGNHGEYIATDYLNRHGYKIVERNCRLGRREIDIIANQNDKRIFIEVKTRVKTTDSIYENPLSKQQIHNLKLAIIDYCRKNRFPLETVRLDLIIILIDQNQKTAALKHYRDIF